MVCTKLHSCINTFNICYTIAVRACKKAINEGLDLPMDEAIVLEEKLFGSCFKTHDQIEGMEAFLTKRKEKNFINA